MDTLDKIFVTVLAAACLVICASVAGCVGVQSWARHDVELKCISTPGCTLPKFWHVGEAGGGE